MFHKPYILYHFRANPDQLELLLALLAEYPFEAFEEGDSELKAYVTEDAEGDVESLIKSNLKSFYTSFKRSAIPTKNWNEVWEAGFQPIIVDDFCRIRASFHEPDENVKHDLVIDPKMAFGTGHHATTLMMIQQMAHLDFRGISVLDFGTGTGVLGILASKLGASVIDAVEIDPQACENCRENTALNNVGNMHVIPGGIETVPDRQYEIILANINRNVILDTMSEVTNHLLPNGTLVYSGILIEDMEKVIGQAEETGLELVSRITKGEWSCLEFKRA